MSDAGQNPLETSGDDEAAEVLAKGNVAEEDRIAAWTAGKALLSFLPGGGAVVEVVNGIQFDSDEGLADLVMRGMDAAAKARFEERSPSWLPSSRNQSTRRRTNVSKSAC
ncbi:hypothetical protein ACIRSS_47415 [Amycolatopsis sp. NPDC101161]|uniref:hypothetical protein n=1 Tax=Amycolatopsis sp. NPDC101161 TaxID=3363940 RepID=UPI003827F7D4